MNATPSPQKIRTQNMLSPRQSFPGVTDDSLEGNGDRVRKRPKWSISRTSTHIQPDEDHPRHVNWEKSMRKSDLSFRRLRDVNSTCPSDSSICSTEFDATGRLLLTAGLDAHVRIFAKQVNSDSYDSRHSLFVEGVPIYRAGFLGRTNGQVMLAGSRSLYLSDIETSTIEKIRLHGNWRPSSFVTHQNTKPAIACVPGDQGSVAVISLSSRTRLTTLSAEGYITGVTFGACERDLMTVNHEGTVYVWDLRMNRCKQKVKETAFYDATTLAFCEKKGLMAVGTASGLVGLQTGWDTSCKDDVLSPVKVVQSLKTKIDSLRFDSTGALLLTSSSQLKGIYFGYYIFYRISLTTRWRTDC